MGTGVSVDGGGEGLAGLLQGRPEAGALGEKTPPCVVSLSLDLLKECALVVFLEWTCPC